jgi:hypothetical protein
MELNLQNPCCKKLPKITRHPPAHTCAPARTRSHAPTVQPARKSGCRFKQGKRWPLGVNPRRKYSPKKEGIPLAHGREPGETKTKRNPPPREPPRPQSRKPDRLSRPHPQSRQQQATTPRAPPHLASSPPPPVPSRRAEGQAGEGDFPGILLLLLPPLPGVSPPPPPPVLSSPTIPVSARRRIPRRLCLSSASSAESP